MQVERQHGTCYAMLGKEVGDGAVTMAMQGVGTLLVREIGKRDDVPKPACMSYLNEYLSRISYLRRAQQGVGRLFDNIQRMPFAMEIGADMGRSMILLRI